MSLLTPAARSDGQHSYVGLIKILRVFLNHLIRQFSAHHLIGPAGIDEDVYKRQAFGFADDFV